MKYQNDIRKLYINDNNIPVVASKSLTQEQKALLDSIISVAEIYNNFDNFNFIYKMGTIYLNLTQFISDKSNIINFPSYEQALTILRENFDRSIYGAYLVDINSMIDFIPERFANLGINLSYSFNYIKTDYKNNSIEYLNEDFRNVGKYNFLMNEVDFKFPIFIFNRKDNENNKENLDFLSSIYPGFIRKSLHFLIHELKHAFNRHTFINMLKDKKISPFEALKLYKYEEYSAEMEAIFFDINQRELLKKYIDLPVLSAYQDVINYVNTHENYTDNLPEFVSVVKNSVKNNFLNPSFDFYDNNYSLNRVRADINYFPSHFVNKSDDGIYEKIKKEMLSFEILNPKTRKIELVDLSSFFEDKEISSYEKYVMNKDFRKRKKVVRYLRKESNISNKTLKIINNVLDNERK